LHGILKGIRAQILESQASKDEKEILEPKIRALHQNDGEIRKKERERERFKSF